MAKAGRPRKPKVEKMSFQELTEADKFYIRANKNEKIEVLMAATDKGMSLILDYLKSLPSEIGRKNEHIFRPNATRDQRLGYHEKGGAVVMTKSGAERA